MDKNVPVPQDRRLEKKAKFDEAYLFIRDRILHDMRSDQPLSELNLASVLGMSRTPVREALKRLENEGILISYGKRGTFINIPTLKEIKDIYEVRMLLEPGAARLASKKVNLDELNRFKKLFKDFREGKGRGDFVKLGEAFHFFIIDSTENKVLREILNNIYAKLEISRVFSYGVRRKEAVEEHLEILGALQDGDEERSQRCMENHLKNAFKALTSIL
jgi:DNA-binding GntR family transcriptional regulator